MPRVARLARVRGRWQVTEPSVIALHLMTERMLEMAKQIYVVPFEITGDIEVQAESAEDAQRQVDRLTKGEFAAHGELWSGEPKLKLKMPETVS